MIQKVFYNKIFVAWFLGFVFFIFGILTLTHYGINWDTINHLPRGQSYLHYFLTGNKDFSDLPNTFGKNVSLGEWYWQKPESLLIDTNIPENAVSGFSLYHRAGVDFNYFIEKDGQGHPPLSDILSSFFNHILFQKLHLINDIDSYRIYGILLAACLVALIYHWTTKVYGSFVGLIAALSLSLYPLFWSESHFNTEKDIPQTVFWGFFLFSFWNGINKKSWKWISASGVFFGLALGTKFNILFVVFVVGPWLLWYIFKNKLFKDKIMTVKLMLQLLIVPVLGFGIFFLSWPYLWGNPVENLQGVFGFYREIGGEQNIAKSLGFPLNIETYPLKAILYTTPLVVLSFFFIGFIRAAKLALSEKHATTLLILLWLAVPIARVTVPGATIYGGTRQIMEYIPAMAIIAGLGADGVRKFIERKFKYRSLAYIFILLSFVPILIKLIQIHPNENVYFNPLIGGLSGAKKINFPFWGNSFGAAYRQGVVWINSNAEYGAKVAYARELFPNFPRIWLRPDLTLFNTYRSGHLKEGEYIIALTYQGTANTSYHDRYLERLLEPVYTVDVDGISILKVWKNDLEHTKDGFKAEEELFDFRIATEKKGEINVDLKKQVSLKAMEISLANSDCSNLLSAYAQVSKDGLNWERLPGVLPNEDWSVPRFGVQPNNGKVLVPFAADYARYIKFTYQPLNTCLYGFDKIEIFTYK